MTTRIFSEKKASGFLKTTTSKPPRKVSIIFFLLSAKKYFLSVERFLHKKQTSVQNTFMFLVLFCFFPMDLFFIALQKPLRTIAVLFSSQFFSIPRVVVKKSFSTRKNILFLYF